MTRFTLGALLLSEDVLRVVRRELRGLVDVKCSMDEIRSVLQNEVIKRDVLEGDKAASAARMVARAERKEQRQKARSAEEPVIGEDSPAAS